MLSSPFQLQNKQHILHKNIVEDFSLQIKLYVSTIVGATDGESETLCCWKTFIQAGVVSFMNVPQK